MQSFLERQEVFGLANEMPTLEKAHLCLMTFYLAQFV
jgi:hypothetical protein